VATYTVKAPDGKTITLQGPDGASQSDIIAQAQTLYKPETPAPKPAAKPAVAQQSSYLKRYNDLRDGLVRSAKDTADAQRRVTAFNSDPRAQRLRQAAGLAPLSTRQGEVQTAARKTLDQRLRDEGTASGSKAGTLESAAAGISRGLFGIPEMLGAAAERFLPSSITGNNTDASYNNILQLIRAKDTAAIAVHPYAGLAGEAGSAIVGGGAAGKLIKAGGERLAATSVPALARAGNFLENLTTLRKGQKLANTGKIIATGAAAGGAQAAGTGEDVGEGAVTGAVAAPLLLGGFKAAQVITRPFRDVLRITGANRFLSRLTTATKEQLEKRAAEYRAKTGAEPTLFELMPLADRNKILKTVVVGKDNIVEQTSNAIRKRAQNLGPEMGARAQEILTPQRRFIQRGLHQDIAAARGGALAPGDAGMIAKAMDNPTDMLTLRDEEARAIMKPHDDTTVVPNLEDLFPQVPGPDGSAVGTDPEVQNVIRNAAGLIRQRTANSGLTAGDITGMISKLRPMQGAGGNEGMVAERAINHLHDVLDTNAPDAGAAARQMAEAYAARSRMAEGMKEGAAQRLRGDVQVGTSRQQARTVRNAYDSPEGATGLSLGQGNRVLSELGGSPEEALRATVKQSRGSTGRQLTQNIGPAESEALGRAARAQDESAQALASASDKAQGGSGDGADAEMLVQAIAGLHPATFITTKASAVRKLLDMTYIPENRARTIVDMLFSQDPAMTSRALKAIGTQPNGAGVVKTLAQLAGQGSAEAQAESPPTPDVIPDSMTPPAEDVPAPTDAPAADEEPPAIPAGAENSAYAPALLQIYQTESPDLINLIQRVKMQESGGDQNAVSDKGAVGVMQVMPDTAPEAARLAGVQWDENAYRTDAAYNEILGIAYLSELLRKYDGDVNHALAAYNAGPGAVDDAVAEHDTAWLDNLPAETQDYVARVG
jgi:hypothetical protein